MNPLVYSIVHLMPASAKQPVNGLFPLPRISTHAQDLPTACWARKGTPSFAFARTSPQSVPPSSLCKQWVICRASLCMEPGVSRGTNARDPRHRQPYRGYDYWPIPFLPQVSKTCPAHLITWHFSCSRKKPKCFAIVRLLVSFRT